MEQGIPAKPVLYKLRRENNLIEPKRTNKDISFNEETVNKEPNWEKLEEEYYSNRLINSDY